MLNIPSPLKEVMAYEGVLDPFILDHGPALGVQTNAPLVTRWGIFGLPGMGKSSLSKAIFQKSRKSFPLLIIPEAADYAVKVLGYALIEFEPFLNQVYEQAERLSREIANLTGNVVIIREPSIVQNEVYLIVQKRYQETASFRLKLAEMAHQAEIGIWDHQLVADISLVFRENKERLLSLASGPWLNSYAFLTTGDFSQDLELSLQRQQNIDRDRRLMTSDLAMLCGYAIGITACVQLLEENGSKILRLDPYTQLERLNRDFFDTIVALRS